MAFRDGALNPHVLVFIILSSVGRYTPLMYHTIPNCCLCALERAYREGKSKFKKPISCALYPIRAKDFGNEVYGINYNKWRICKDAIKKGEELNLPVYKFLEGPLVEKFGKEWYDELCEVAEQVLAELED